LKYMAAFIPRYMRTLRLPHLPLNVIIGSKMLNAHKGQGMIYDAVMLPELDFQRMKLYLSGQVSGTITLERGPVQPAYIPQGVAEITIPPNEQDPETFARLYFLEEFGLEDYLEPAALTA